MFGRKNIRQEFADTMLELGNKDKNLVVMVGDISHGKLKNFAKKFKSRYINVGILEPTMISMGAGFSKVGINPVLHTISPFIIEKLTLFLCTIEEKFFFKALSPAGPITSPRIKIFIKIFLFP